MHGPCVLIQPLGKCCPKHCCSQVCCNTCTLIVLIFKKKLWITFHDSRNLVFLDEEEWFKKSKTVLKVSQVLNNRWNASTCSKFSYRTIWPTVFLKTIGYCWWDVSKYQGCCYLINKGDNLVIFEFVVILLSLTFVFCFRNLFFKTTMTLSNWIHMPVCLNFNCKVVSRKITKTTWDKGFCKSS